MVIEGQSNGDAAVHIPSATDIETVPNTQTGPSNTSSDVVSNVAQLDDAARQLIEAEWCTEYEKIPKVERKWGIQKVEEIEPALDDMINAKDCPVRCSRWPLVV
jgi:hypothetical protein